MANTQTTKPLLSPAFVEFVSHLDPTERELVSAKRAESMQEFFRNRSATLDTRED